MANRRFIRYIVTIAFVVFLPGVLLAYDNETTHRAITQEAINVFEYNYPEYQFTKSEIQKIEDGSSNEDNSARYLWHFYDPVHNVGFASQFETSKLWAEDTSWQARQIRKINPFASYFGSDSDYSWDRAIFDYVHGDKERGLESLGHIIHLVEDKAVPDHTRNDNHAISSPYETFAKKYTVNNLSLAVGLVSEGKKPIIYGQLGDYFDNLAEYSNNNFFSQDTIFSKDFNLPQIKKEQVVVLENGKKIIYGVGLINNIEFKLAQVTKNRNIENGTIFNTYVFNDDSELVVSDYWALLSKQAVLNSAGVIKLFFDQVAEEERTNALAEKNKSFALKTYDKIAASVGNALAAVNLFADKESKEAETLATTTPVVNLVSNQDPQTDKEKLPTLPVLEDLNKVKIALLQQVISLLQQYQEKLGAVKSGAESAVKLVAVQTFLSGQSSGLHSHKDLEPLAQEIDQITPTTTEIVILPPVITAPTDLAQIFSTDSLTFSGTASSGQMIFTDYSKATTTVDSGGLWSLALDGLEEGTTTLNFFAKDIEGNISDPLAVTIFVELPKTLSLTAEIAECQNSFIDEACVIPAKDKLNVSFLLEGGTAAYYQVAHEYDYSGDLEREVLASTTDTTTEVILPGWFEKIVFYAFDQNDQVMASTSIPLVFRNKPLVINEIAPLGTMASSSDEWIELYNPMPYNYDLSGIVLRSQDKKFAVELTGTLRAEGFYLIERGDDDVVSDEAADIVTDFGATSEEDVFPADNIQWELVKTVDDEEIVLDQTPADLSYCPIIYCEDVFGDGPMTEIYTLERAIDEFAKEFGQYWVSNLPQWLRNGLDRNGNEIKGTPKKFNSANVPIPV